MKHLIAQFLRLVAYLLDSRKPPTDEGWTYWDEIQYRDLCRKELS